MHSCKFADDTKLGGAVDSLEGGRVLTGDLDRLDHWTMIIRIKFRKSKCFILHIGLEMPKTGMNLEKTGCNQLCRRDLAVMVDSGFSRRQQEA